MNRRDLITLLGGAATTWPLAARAQQSALPVIGFLHTDTLEATTAIIAEFRKGLAEVGYVESHNLTIEFRWAQYENTRLSELAADLVSHRVVVIATPGSSAAALAAKAATRTIPIVFGFNGDPVRLGLVASINRPGGNVTGFTGINVELGPKRIGLLHTSCFHKPHALPCWSIRQVRAWMR
jgi:putative tryptophan/tyrosine transport system substrate-binding protein